MFTRMQAPHFLKLNLITHMPNSLSFSYEQYANFILNAVRSGVTSVQLRFKHQSVPEILPFAFKLKSLLFPLKIPLIVNDNVELAQEIQAQGVHLGQSDTSPQEARRLLGEKVFVGWSIESFEDLDRANELDGLTYVTASAVFPSKTKTNCKKFWGLDGLKEIVQLSRHPVTAIGGINIQNVESVLRQGAVGISVIEAIHNSPNPLATTEEFMRIIEENLKRRPYV